MFSRLGQGFTGEAMKQVEKLEAENEKLKDANATLQRRFEEHRSSNITIKRDLIAKVELLESANTKASKDLADSRAENKQLTAKLREQTESDILLNALKAVGIIKEDKPEKPDYFDEHKRLLREHAHMKRLADYSRAQGDMSLTRPSDLFGGAFGRMI